MKPSSKPCPHCLRPMVRILTCRDCGSAFDLDAAAELFFANKGWPNPKRCDKCLAVRKAKANDVARNLAGITNEVTGDVK